MYDELLPSIVGHMLGNRGGHSNVYQRLTGCGWRLVTYTPWDIVSIQRFKMMGMVYALRFASHKSSENGTG